MAMLGVQGGRELRVFVSSTFLDMKGERDALCSLAFPRLRQLCETRGVVWTDVDLRWGVTDEARAEGNVLSICLAEITRCRPHFICILGERYGWVPDVVSPEVLHQYPWLRAQGGASVTELEVAHAVLNEPELCPHAFFYFREPAEASGSVLVAENEMVSALKQRIREAHRAGRLRNAPREGFKSPEQLAGLVLDDFQRLIGRLFPEGAAPDPEQNQQTGFALARSLEYVERAADYAALDRHCAGDGPSLIVVGEAGSGKSALLVNWISRVRAASPELLVLAHHTAADMRSVRRALLRWVRELEGSLGEPAPPTAEDEEPFRLRLRFLHAVHRVAESRRLLLVLDGISEMVDETGSVGLGWLPRDLPANLRCVVSARPGARFDELAGRGWSVLQVEPLSVPERKLLVESLFARYGKTLAGQQLETIANAAATTNPLYLRILLEELRVFGDHAALDGRLRYYLAARDISDLYERVFVSWEKRYERDDSLVGDVLGLLASASRGLSRRELLDLLGTGTEPLPQAELAPLLVAARDSIGDNAGLLTLGNQALKDAVYRVYLPNEDTRRELHRKLSRYFAAQRLGSRKLEELPVHLLGCGDYQELERLLTDPEFLEASVDHDAAAVAGFWVALEQAGGTPMDVAYASVANGEGSTEHAWRVVQLLHARGWGDAALRIYARLTQAAVAAGDYQRAALTLQQQATLLRERGDLSAARDAASRAEVMLRAAGDQKGLQRNVVLRAELLARSGEFDAALELVEQAEELARELDTVQGLRRALTLKGMLFAERGDAQQALPLLEWSETMCRATGDLDGLQTTLGNQACLHRDLGNFERALDLVTEQQNICENAGIWGGLERVYAFRSSIYRLQGNLDRALAATEAGERLCRALGRRQGLANALGQKATILITRGELSLGEALLLELDGLCREIENFGVLERCLRMRATILQKRGDLEGALRLLVEHELLCRSTGNISGLSGGLNALGGVLAAAGKDEEALRALREEEKLLESQDAIVPRQGCLTNQAMILSKLGRDAEALEMLSRVEHTWRLQNIPTGLMTTLVNRAAILQRRGELERAESLYAEAEQIARSLGDKESLIITLNNRGRVLQAQGRFTEAANRIAEALRLAEAHGFTRLHRAIEDALE